MTTPDWKAVTNLLVQNHRLSGYGYVFPVQMWTPDIAPDLTVGGHEAVMVDVGIPDFVLQQRDVNQKVLRRWLWDLRGLSALSPHRLSRTVVWHFWDEDEQESAFGIASFTRYDAAQRLTAMQSKETDNAKNR